ncbi:MAG: hypothetical protein RMK18_12815, partial [Armatimonadota bacterium]|nr:hypothetical protein [Armatimonadota bacterium]
CVTPTSEEKKGSIVVNVTGFEYDSLLGCATVKGKVKNFTMDTYQTLSLRFIVYNITNCRKE